MLSSLTFGGTSSQSFGLHIERCPNQNRPERKIDRYSVPGRNGDLIIMQDAWENVEQSYEIWGGDGSNNDATDVGYDIANWLFSKTGYQRLEDTYDTTHYRQAYFEGPFYFESVLRRRGRCEIIFSCDPRRFLLTGETSTNYLNGTRSYTNPTKFVARPKITVHGSGSGYVQANGNKLTISDITEGMILDCENQNAYLGSTNLNSYVSGKFPTLAAGTKNIIISGGITSIDMVPNWWEL